MEYRRHTLNSYDEENPEMVESWVHPNDLTTWQLLWSEFKKLICRYIRKQNRTE